VLKRSWLSLSFSLLAIVLASSACQTRQPAADSPCRAAVPADSDHQGLMDSIVDTNADVVWLSVSNRQQRKGAHRDETEDRR
jgi:hypothetical protein